LEISEPSDRVELAIGERTFNTTRTTLQESRRLSNLLRLAEGPYYVDADPSLFEHILRYLRTGLYPISHDAQTGHDEVFYHHLLNQARFYQIDKLETWLRGKEYRNAVRQIPCHISLTLYGPDQIEHLHEFVPGRNGSVSILTGEHSQKECHLCPNREWRLDGRKADCLNAGCLTVKQARFSHSKMMEVVKVECIVTRVEVDEKRLMRSPQNEVLPPPFHETS